MISTPNLYSVHLDPTQRQSLEEIARNGHAPVKKVRHAQILLLSDHDRPGGKRTDGQIAEALDMHVNTVARVRKRFVIEGERPALERKRRETPPVPPKIDGRVEGHIIAICTGPPPEGRCRWTMELIAGELVRREVVTSISDEAVRLALKKTRSSPGRSSRGASRSETMPGSSPTWNASSTSMPPSTPPRSR
jgi:Homeodomain-like domain